jgi:hypothetical protein
MMTKTMATGDDDNDNGDGAAGEEVDDDGDDHDYVDRMTTMATARRATARRDKTTTMAKGDDGRRRCQQRYGARS